MTAECAALGGLGVIGVTADHRPVRRRRGHAGVPGVRHRGSGPGVTSRAKPFASDLSGQDFTKLVAHGWVPVGLALGVAVGYRHDDWLTQGQTRWTAGNAEVDGYSYLVRQMRTDARNELELDLVRMGAEGVVVREMETQISERRCPIVPFGKDHVVQATIVGTAIAQFAEMAPPPIYGIRRLDGRRPEPPPPQRVSVGLGGEAETSEKQDGSGHGPGQQEPGNDQPDRGLVGRRPLTASSRRASLDRSRGPRCLWSAGSLRTRWLRTLRRWMRSPGAAPRRTRPARWQR